jgi:broad specificity phosphatase PhoE
MLALAEPGPVIAATPNSLVAPDSASTTVIMVRHAEKDTTLVGADPPLSAKGILRAQALRHVLKDAGVAAIYVTPYLRNRQTAQPLATALGESLTVVYPVEETVQRLRTRHRGQSVLVVGHSDTVPQIVASLARRPFPTPGHVPYDGMWVVTIAEDGGASLLRLRYGSAADTPQEPVSRPNTLKP